MTTVIKVENLGKKYIINHTEQERYLALRDVITNAAKNLFKPNLLKANEEDFWALEDLNFEIKQGDRVGIIGRNGAGKSTLLKVLSRITEPTTGRVKIRGNVASLLEVGTGFHPELTGRENIFLNGAILGMKKSDIKKKFDEIVAFAEVEKFLDTPVKRYSSGMYVRLAFAVAAHLESEILIVDEVLAVGDAQFQKKCLGKMEDVGKNGRTVLFVSHNMAAIQQLCSSCINLSKGKLIFMGTSHQAVEHYMDSQKRMPQYIDDGYIDLENTRDKNYRAKIFKKIRLLDKNNLSQSTFPMMGSLKIEIILNSTKAFSGMDYSIAIHTLADQRLTSFATWMSTNKTPTPSKIVLDIPKIIFASGSYKIYLSMTHPVEGEYIDRIDNAITFHVEAVEIFGTGRQFDASYGQIALEGSLVLV